MTTHAELERLAALGRTLDVAVSDKTLDEAADLCLRLHQEAARRARAILTPAQNRSYAERGDVERQGMRSAVRHVIAALVLLDLIELP